MAKDLEKLVPAFLSLTRKLAATQAKLEKALLSSNADPSDFKEILKNLNRLKNGIKRTQKIHFPSTVPSREQRPKPEVLHQATLKMDLERSRCQKKRHLRDRTS